MSCNIEFVTRFATMNDFTFIWDGILETISIEGASFRDEADELDYKQRLTKAIEEGGQVLLACDKDQILPLGILWYKKATVCPYGVGDYGENEKDYLWIQLVFVAKEHRNKGVATFLYKKLDDVCKELQVKEIMCDVYWVNTGSRNFHEKMGYRPKVILYSKDFS